MRKMHKQSEKDLQKSIIDYLTLKKYLVVKFSSVGIYKQKTGSYIPQRQRGVSDLLACSPTGRFIAIEVKIKRNRPTKEQLAFIQEVRKRGGIGFVAYSLDDVINKLKYD